MAVQCPGHQFLAGARFTCEQYRHIGTGQAPDGAKDLLHGWCFADDLRGSVLDAALARVVAAVLFDGAPHQVDGLVHVEGFGQVFESPPFVGCNGAVQVGVGGHDDDRQFRVEFLDAFHEGETIHAWHANVYDQSVR